MLARRFLNCLTFIVLSKSMLLDWIAADPVHQMSKLLNFPRWRGLHPLEIVDDSTHYYMNNLLETDTEGRTVVTVDNVDDKVRQAHHFLSCQYTIVFLTYQEYLFRLSKACLQMNSSDDRDCLHKFRQIFNPENLVSHMQSALIYFHSLSPHTALKTDVSDILKRFSEAYEPIGYLPNGDDTFGYNKEIAYGRVDILLDIEIKALEFFKKSCGPSSHLKEKKFGSSTYSWVVDILNETSNNTNGCDNEAHTIYTMANDVISEFLVMDYALLGFESSAELNTTVLNETSDSVKRVQKIIEIRSNPSWSRNMGHLRLTVDKQEYSLEYLLIAEIDEHNIDIKIRIIYELMSYFFVEITLDLLYYCKSISRFYHSILTPKHKYLFLESFVQNVKKSYPVVVYMKSAILNYQRLSPRTSDTYISKILTFFKNFLEITNFYDTEFYNKNENVYYEEKLDAEMKIFLNNLSEIIKKVNDYSKISSVVTKHQKQRKIIKDRQKRIEKQYVFKIELLKNVVFPELGLILTV